MVWLLLILVVLCLVWGVWYASTSTLTEEQSEEVTGVFTDLQEAAGGGTMMELSYTRKARAKARQTLDIMAEKLGGVIPRLVPRAPPAKADVSEIQELAEQASTLMGKAGSLFAFAHRQMGKSKILASFAQVICEFDSCISVPWPPEFLIWINSFAFVNLDFFSSLSVECIADGKWNFFRSSQVTIFFPVFVCSIQGLVWLLQSWRGALSMKAVEWHWRFLLLFLFLIYPYTASTTLKIWRCDDIEDTWYAAQCR
jgi:hypothetical protein